MFSELNGKGKLLRISSSLNSESEEPGKVNRDYALHSGSREVLLPNFHATARSLHRGGGSFFWFFVYKEVLNSLFFTNLLLSSAFNFSMSQFGHMPTSKHSGSSLQRKKLFLLDFSLHTWLIFPGSSASRNVSFWCLFFSRYS